MTTKCPKCQGSNSHELGGNDRCFHCSECGYIQCVDATHSPGHQPAATEGTQEGPVCCGAWPQCVHTLALYERTVGTVEPVSEVDRRRLEAAEKAMEPATPQTTELPPLSWTAAHEACEGNFTLACDERERQLSAALTQLAALRTSRDALLVALKQSQWGLIEIDYETHEMGCKRCRAIAERGHEEDCPTGLAIAAAQQLQEDGNV